MSNPSGGAFSPFPDCHLEDCSSLADEGIQSPHPPRWVHITDDLGESCDVELKAGQFVGAVRSPNYPPDSWEARYGSWLASKLKDGAALEIWNPSYDLLVVVERNGTSGVAIGDERRDDLLQRQYPLTTTTTTAGPSSLANNEPDGPFGADAFRFDGVEVRFRRAVRRYRLVLALWETEANRPAPPRAVVDVINDVYGHDNNTSDAAFRQLCSDTRGDFQKANIPLDIKLSGQGLVQLVRV